MMKFGTFVVTFFLASVAVHVQGFALMSSSSSTAAAVTASRHYGSQSQRAPAAFILQSAASGASSETTTTTTRSSEDDSDNSDNSSNNNPLGLTPELLKLTLAFESIGDDKLRYKQLLYMANQLAPMGEEYQIDSNKVPGCLSTVYIHATLDKTNANSNAGGENAAAAPPVVNYMGDSDGLLTKGLVALLVRGFSGNTAESIQHVDPAFIKQAGIDASLTPGRNNGFLNMLAVMKRKAAELMVIAEAEQLSRQGGSQQPSTSVTTTDSAAVADVVATAQSSQASGTPMHDAIMAALQAELEPVKLTVLDISEKYGTVETHFTVEIVSDKFDKLNVIKRQKLVYASLGNVMPKIEALQIQAFTPAETVQ
jgi:sulfur transfer protein SufE/stress-induced morphogen